jgi:hypothetical protein
LPAPIERYNKLSQKLSVFYYLTGSETSYYKCTACPVKKRFYAYELIKGHLKMKEHPRVTGILDLEVEKNGAFQTPNDEN